MKTIQLPLFPLHTVLFPGGPLPLRIFEARYLDMVSQCLQEDSGFGVCMIRHGREVGEPASTENMGVVARIVDWHQRHDGLLGITAIGEQRFRIASVRIQDNQLAKKMGAEAKKRFENDFRAEEMVNKTRSIYKSALKLEN